jgi:midasin (ATPase involved in ribosome maturation)
MIRDQYESPLLNESLFLSNYILACFNVEVTPLMKLLTCMEFLLQKLEEWENTYASKRLNSVESEINSLKLLVIRYRKIQILSWRNLLNWKKDRLVRDDFENSIRLAHTISK